MNLLVVRSKTNALSLHFKKLEKENQIKPKMKGVK